jgi:hypothetical protein
MMTWATRLGDLAAAVHAPSNWMPEVPPPWPTEVMVDRRTGSTAGCWSLAEARPEDPRGCRGRSVWPAPAGISVHTSSSAPFAKGGLERLAWPPAVPLLAVTEAWRSARSPAPLRPAYSLVLVSPFSLTLPPPGRSLTGDSARLRRVTTGPISVSLPTHPEKDGCLNETGTDRDSRPSRPVE